MLSKLALPQTLPSLTGFSISRVRQADEVGLPTTGHLLSHNTEELRQMLEDTDTRHILALDDTSFTGTTSLVLERLLRDALPERAVAFTHGFLILNQGELGNDPGAEQRLRQVGSRALGGMHMNTPHDDGWHFFDIVEQADFSEHLEATMALMREPDSHSSKDLHLLFPNLLTHDELVDAQKLGRLVTGRPVNGEFHARNPQLLPNIVAQGHLLPPRSWREGEAATLQHLHKLNELLQGDTHE